MDIAITWNSAEARGDFTVSDGDLDTGDDLVTAVLISLFTDRRADPDDRIPDGTDNPRGWCGDAGQDAPIGSKLWLYTRYKRERETLHLVRRAVEECLAWMLTDGVASQIGVGALWRTAGRLEIIVNINLKRSGLFGLTLDMPWEG